MTKNGVGVKKVTGGLDTCLTFIGNKFDSLLT
jgi:hypothetical protein